MAPMEFFIFLFFILATTASTAKNMTCPADIPCECKEMKNPDTNIMEKVIDCQNRGLTETPSFLKFARKRFDVLLLNNNKISALLRGAFQGLTVDRIELSDNPDLITFTNYAFNGVSGLKSLVIENGRLSSVPVAFEKLPQLQELKLKNNMIRALPENAFSQLRDLKYLDLSNNRAEFTRPFVSFQNLEKLEHLDLNQNGLYNIPIEALESKPNLKTLVLSNNKIKHVPLHVLKGLKSLKRLELVGNPIILKDTKSSPFPGLELEMLSISNCRNKIKVLTPQILADLHNVRNLTIRECGIKTIPRGTFHILRHLQYLDISGNPVKLTPQIFEGIEGQLTTIKLDKMNLKAYPMKLLAIFPKLSDISLNNNNFSFLPGGIFKFLPYKGSRISVTNSSIVKVSKHVMDGVNRPASLLLANNNIRSLAFITRHPCRFDDTYVDLRNNPIHCNCNTYRMVQHKIFELVGKCHTPRHHHGLELIWRPGRNDVEHFEMSTNATEECSDEPRHEQKYDCACKTWQNYHSPRVCTVYGKGHQYTFNTFLMLSCLFLMFIHLF